MFCCQCIFYMYVAQYNDNIRTAEHCKNMFEFLLKSLKIWWNKEYGKLYNLLKLLTKGDNFHSRMWNLSDDAFHIVEQETPIFYIVHVYVPVKTELLSWGLVLNLSKWTAMTWDLSRNTWCKRSKSMACSKITRCKMEVQICSQNRNLKDNTCTCISEISMPPKNQASLLLLKLLIWNNQIGINYQKS